MGIGALLKAAGLVASGSEGLRMVEQGGVRIDGTVVSDKALRVSAPAPSCCRWASASSCASP
jgi:tyrosyl-tRNA synthetase